MKLSCVHWPYLTFHEGSVLLWRPFSVGLPVTHYGWTEHYDNSWYGLMVLSPFIWNWNIVAHYTTDNVDNGHINTRPLSDLKTSNLILKRSIITYYINLGLPALNLLPGGHHYTDAFQIKIYYLLKQPPQRPQRSKANINTWTIRLIVDSSALDSVKEPCCS